MNIAAIMLAWLGCAGAYLSSDRQNLLPRPLPKLPAWLCFSVSLTLAASILARVYNPLAGTLMTLMFVMCLWPALVLSAAYMPRRPLLLNALAVLGLALLMGVG